MYWHLSKNTGGPLRTGTGIEIEGGIGGHRADIQAPPEDASHLSHPADCTCPGSEKRGGKEEEVTRSLPSIMHDAISRGAAGAAEERAGGADGGGAPAQLHPAHHDGARLAGKAAGGPVHAPGRDAVLLRGADRHLREVCSSMRFDAATLWATPTSQAAHGNAQHALYTSCMLAQALQGAAACNACDTCPVRAGDMAYCLLGAPVLIMRCFSETLLHVCRLLKTPIPLSYTRWLQSPGIGKSCKPLLDCEMSLCFALL